MDKNPKSSKILLVNVQNLMNEDTINDQVRLLSIQGIKADFYETTGKPQASFEEFRSFVLLILNEPLVQQYLNGILTNAAWDILKSTILQVWRATLGKKYHIFRANAEPETKDVTFGITLKSKENEIHFQCSSQLSEEMQSKCIDKAFDTFARLCEEAKGEISPHVARFDKEWKLVDKKKVIEEKQKQKRKKK